MRTFAHHYTDTPHGESHAPISISVLATLTFIAAQSFFYVYAKVATPFAEPTLYSGSNPFTVASIVITMLLMAFLVVDFRRNRIEAHGAQRFQFVVFGVAAVLLAAFMFFMAKVVQLGGTFG